MTITGTISHKIQRKSVREEPIVIALAEKQRPTVSVDHQRMFPWGIRRDEAESQGDYNLLVTKQGLNSLFHLSLKENVARLMIVFLCFYFMV